jgi:F-type H+-transporting ATPase subunit delta
MKINKQAKREAKQLFRFCLVNGLLDENRVRNVVQDVIAAGHSNCLAILSHFRRLVRL